MGWQFIESGRMPPQSIMKKDEALLASLDHTSDPILHLYEWDSPCLTYGYFTDPLKYLKEEGLKKHGLCTARRPTGGGIIFHVTDFAFSLLVPAAYPYFSLNTLENYAYINQLIIQTISPLIDQNAEPELLKKNDSISKEKPSFCMAQPTQYDIVVQEKKLGGAAQRRTKQGYLHQGSLSLALPDLELLQDVLKDSQIGEAMQQCTYSILDANWSLELLENTRQIIKSLLIRRLNRV